MSPPTIAVYCEGPVDAPHERFIVAAYQRTHETATRPASAWMRLKVFNGIHPRSGEKGRGPDPSDPLRGGYLSHRFHCERCGFDEIRSDSDGSFCDHLYGVFDKLWSHGLDPLEVSLRGLLHHT